MTASDGPAERAMEAPPDAIRREIERSGPIGFDRFMELALYGRGGFFQRATSPVGADADFVTSPHVHPYVFSRCVRAALLDGWHALGEPAPLEIVEVGGGDGTFASALIDAFSELPAPAVRYTAVEIGDGAREAARQRGLTTARAIDDVEPLEGMAIANELLDNLPVLVARRDGDTIVEVRIGLDDGGSFVRVPVPWSDDAVAAEDLAWLRDGDEAAVPTGAATFVPTLAARLRRGYAILVDYGRRGRSDAPHGYVEQRRVDDVLAGPGSRDITAGVDVDLIARLAERNGLVAFEPVRQRAALDALGLRRWDETMRERQAELQANGRGGEAVRVWESRSRASILVAPERLGSLWWIVVATPGLPEPSWLAPARDADRPPSD
jgi:NADH dehydrogenase [ubiquinone] 1 alpha subcomplex assembly factor 7